MKKDRVLVSMSGGVDSSVAALLLMKEGFDVIGVTMNIWQNDKTTRACCSLLSIDDARRVANKIGIPFYVLNFKEIFKETVVKNFIDSYISGETPNPCVKCNEIIKFQYLLNKAKELNCKFIATGHYARIKKDKNKYLILRGKDDRKDQTYFLHVLKQNMLKNILFPVGDYTKEEVRRIAKNFELPVANKPESQEVCFVPDRNYPKFIMDFTNFTPKPGLIIDKSGNFLGEHKGIIFYTIGQRKRIGISGCVPFYVLSIDGEKNTITVGEDYELYSNELFAKDVNFIIDIKLPKVLNVKIRYLSNPTPAVIYKIDKTKVKVKFKKPVRAITPGQSVVFYKDDILIGGGTIIRYP